MIKVLQNSLQRYKPSPYSPGWTARIQPVSQPVSQSVSQPDSKPASQPARPLGRHGGKLREGVDHVLGHLDQLVDGGVEERIGERHNLLCHVHNLRCHVSHLHRKPVCHNTSGKREKGKKGGGQCKWMLSGTTRGLDGLIEWCHPSPPRQAIELAGPET